MENILGFDLRLIIPILILQLVLIIIALIDLVRREKKTIRGNNKLIWGLVIVMISVLGPIIYLSLGRQDN